MADFTPLFAALRRLMLDCACGMTVSLDGDGVVRLNAPWAHPRKPEAPMEFGSVRTGRAYVAYHLMPVYTHPRLLQTLSDPLRKRMQGKSCFNFRTEDPILFDELAALTAASARLYAGAPFARSGPGGG